ncbi:MAG: TRAM domain-containing protein, partial [Firmicutes bacterium]|nr:TRAM domain-containing protein [Bacillota bacterium]
MSTWQVGQEFTAEITGLTHEGAGVGRVDDRVVFVPGALPGDLIRLKLVHIKERLAYGELDEVLQASLDRVQPWCPHAENCGGCQLQHLNYDAQ